MSFPSAPIRFGISPLIWGSLLWCIISRAGAIPPGESVILSNYSGVIGTAPKDVTISAAGMAVQETPNSTQSYLFFAQTLANQIYYEGRVWGAYNYMSQNPIFSSVSPSNIQNPVGYGVTGIIGYNFHTTADLDITPYFRLNYYKNMVLVYEDSNGNYINTTALASFLGAKLTFKALKTFTPYLNFWMGFQQVAMNGTLTEGVSAYQVQTATVDQIVANTQVGFNFKVSKNISLIPYWQYQTIANYPDGVALATPANGGFGVSPNTSSQQIIGMRFSSAW